jgi:transcriptional regulator GlxA family with amidase domain
VAEPARPTRVLLLVLPRFSLLSFTAAIEPMRVANRLTGSKLYEWLLVSQGGGAVRASNSTLINTDHTLQAAPASEMLIVCASFEVAEYWDREIASFLRRRFQHGATLGGIGTGALVLARAGILRSQRCAIHWENRPAFIEEFPDIPVSTNLYEMDGRLVTCGGGVAALDMMLHLIAREHGPDLAVGVSNQLLHDRLRSPDDHQRTAANLRLERLSQRLASAVRLMEENIEKPLAISEIAGRLGLAQRQLERLFRQHLGATPKQHYTDLRLDRAGGLLDGTGMPIVEIALSCGFLSGAHFSHCYRERFGATPTERRAKARRLQAQ